MTIEQVRRQRKTTQNAGGAAQDDAMRGSAPFSLFRVFVRLFWRRWTVGGLLYMVWCVSAAVQPFIVRHLVEFLKVRRQTKGNQGNNQGLINLVHC